MDPFGPHCPRRVWSVEDTIENGKSSSTTVSVRPLCLPSSKLAETRAVNAVGAEALNEITFRTVPCATCPRSQVMRLVLVPVTKQPVGKVNPSNALFGNGSGFPLVSVTFSNTWLTVLGPALTNLIDKKPCCPTCCPTVSTCGENVITTDVRTLPARLVAVRAAATTRVTASKSAPNNRTRDDATNFMFVPLPWVLSGHFRRRTDRIALRQTWFHAPSSPSMKLRAMREYDLRTRTTSS